MPIYKKITFFLFICLSNLSLAQLNDIARVDFTIIPNVKSDLEFTRSRMLFNYPIKLNDNEEYAIVGLDYSNIHLRFENDELPFDNSLLNDFQSLDLTLGYAKLLKSNWRFCARIRPGFSTNLTAKALSFDDAILSADVIFIKTTKIDNVKKSSLILGVSYSGNRGFPYPLPFVNYFNKLNEKWSYSVGVPKSNLQYYFSDKSRLKLYAELDGFTANLQQGVPLEDIGKAESINMSLILSGLQYEYYFTKHLQLYLRTAYTISNNNNLRDNNRERIFTLDNKSTIYLRGGLRLKI